MLLSTKFSRFSKSLRFATNNQCLDKFTNAKSNSYLSQASLHTLRKEFEKLRFSDLNFNEYRPGKSVNQICCLKYSTEEIPPLPPPLPKSDVFGAMGGLKYEAVALDTDEKKEEERLKTLGGRVPRKLKPSPGQYADMMKAYMDKGDFESAEKIILECRKNYDKPTPYMFTLIIRGLAMQGNVKGCYKYFAQMKAAKHKIKGNVYTSLFNACANSPNSDKALIYLEKIKDYMMNQKEPMNHAHYNALVKAYGQHDEYEKALKLFQQMMDKKMKIGISTLNSLMFAANSNKESGLKHVLHVWQLMRKLRVPPDIFTYNLILRAIRDTNFGSDCSVSQLLLPSEECPAIITDDNRPDLLLYPPVISSLPLKNIHKKATNQLLLDAPTSESTDSEPSESTDSMFSEKSVQILPPTLANLDLDAILKQNKLILFGGVEGFLQKMKNDRITPNVKTVTYLIELVPDSVAAEDAIIKYARSEKLQLDIDFYNMLIKKRALRGATKDAKKVLDDIHRADLRPNIVTYGVMALACNSTSQSKDLLAAMKATGHTINKYVADTLFQSAFYQRDFSFTLQLMEIVRRERVRLEETTYEKLDTFQQKMSGLLKMKHPCAQKEGFKVGFATFNLRYKTWLQDMGRKVVTERESVAK
ncbi:pentatricopeptide repeat-containing protein 1, mitochondrial [Copidosoma floridanum]|uniref:pentatricopeptide repeat-containing protein 1, mitochondrial n=1 Tax=Copidosoma floridanum TaxID=29053 RepID=UPI0006C9D6FB|nr:pentatricopeptide repeat-containing protein 1, mitochondrial [Copidosoma floridanum]